MSEHEKITPLSWVVEGETGISSRTIWAVMMGAIKELTFCGGAYNVPHDNSDFGRCYKLLECFPEWEKRLTEVGRYLPKWRPFVLAWSELKSLYEKSAKPPHTNADILFKRLQECEEEGMFLDGFRRTGPCSWARKGKPWWGIVWMWEHSETFCENEPA